MKPNKFTHDKDVILLSMPILRTVSFFQCCNLTRNISFVTTNIAINQPNWKFLEICHVWNTADLSGIYSTENRYLKSAIQNSVVLCKLQ